MQLVLESLGPCPIFSSSPFIKDGTVMRQECWYMALVAATREVEAARPCELRALKPFWVTQGNPIAKQKQTTNQLSKQNVGMVLTT